MTNADRNPCPSVSPDGDRCTKMRHKDDAHEARTDWGTPPTAIWFESDRERIQAEADARELDDETASYENPWADNFGAYAR